MVKRLHASIIKNTILYSVSVIYIDGYSIELTISRNTSEGKQSILIQAFDWLSFYLVSQSSQFWDLVMLRWRLNRAIVDFQKQECVSGFA